MKYLGIDWGERRWGLATADELCVATPIPAATQAEEAERYDYVARLIKERRIDEIIVGLPLNMDGTEGPKAKQATAFAESLLARFQLPVHLCDETLTSYAAECDMNSKKRREIRKDGIIDSKAATLLLQDWLDESFPQHDELPDPAEDNNW